MTARAAKLRADVTANRGRTVLAVTSLAIGTLAFGAMFLAGRTVDASFRAGFLGSNPPSAVLGTEPFPASLVADVAAHPDVADAQGRRVVQAVVDADGERVDVELVAMPDLADQRIARIEPEEGQWPPEPGAVVLERATTTELGLGIGDDLAVTVPGGAAATLPVTGTAFDVWEIASTLGGLPRAYVDLATMAELTGSTDLDTLYLRAVDDPLDRDAAVALATAVRDDVLSPAGVAVESTIVQDPGEHRASDFFTFLVTALQLLALMALAVAIALVVNTVAALLSQQRRQVGVMKAVGATSHQLVAQYVGYVLVLSAIALVVAVPPALLAGRFLAGSLAGMANFDLLPLGVPWATLAVMALVVTVLPVAAVLVSVRRTARLTVRETLVDRGITASASGGAGRLPLSRPTLLAYRNAVRNRPRLALTVGAVALCGGVLVGVLSTSRSMTLLTDQVAGYVDYDVEVALTEPVALDDAATAVGDVAGVDQVEGWWRAQAFRLRPDGTENENVSITALPPGSTSIRPTLLDGRWLEPGDDHAVVINTHLADEEPDLEVGGEVVLDIEGQRRAWTIVGISSTTLVGPVAHVAVDDLTELLGRPGTTNLAVVGLADGTDATATADRIDEAARAAGLPVGGVQTNAEIRATYGELVGAITGMLLLVAVILAVVAVIGVAGTLTLNVVEQTREIGVLRAIGASSWTVRRVLLLQGLAVAALGAVVGVLLSIPVGLLLRTVVRESLIRAAIPSAFSWTGVAIWLVVALGIGALGATRPARVASRLTIRDTLAYE